MFSLSSLGHKNDLNNATYEVQSGEMYTTICLSIFLCAFYNLRVKERIVAKIYITFKTIP